MQDLVTKPRRDLVTQVANYLAASQGRPVSSSIKVPAFYGGGGLRVRLTTGSLGVRAVHSRWYLDVGVRFLTVFTDQRVNFVGVGAGVGFRF